MDSRLEPRDYDQLGYESQRNYPENDRGYESNPLKPYPEQDRRYESPAPNNRQTESSINNAGRRKGGGIRSLYGEEDVLGKASVQANYAKLLQQQVCRLTMLIQTRINLNFCRWKRKIDCRPLMIDHKFQISQVSDF